MNPHELKGKTIYFAGSVDIQRPADSRRDGYEDFAYPYWIPAKAGNTAPFAVKSVKVTAEILPDGTPGPQTVIICDHDESALARHLHEREHMPRRNGDGVNIATLDMSRLGDSWFTDKKAAQEKCRNEFAAARADYELDMEVGDVFLEQAHELKARIKRELMEKRGKTHA